MEILFGVVIRRFGFLAVVLVFIGACDPGPASESSLSSSVSSSSLLGASTTEGASLVSVELSSVTSVEEPLYVWWWDFELNEAVFVVSGAGVEAGLCRTGFLSGGGRDEIAYDEWSWFENQLKCADGSGTWSHRAEWRWAEGPGILEIVGLTGRYEGLRGTGVTSCDLSQDYPRCGVWGEIRPIDWAEPPEMGVFYARNSDWFIASVGRPGIGLILEASLLGDEPFDDLEERFEYVSGRLVWAETVIEPLCSIEIRGFPEQGLIWIGEPFDEEAGACPEWTDPDAVQHAFQDYGLPAEACLVFTFDGLEHERCGEFSPAANTQPRPTTASPVVTTTTLPLVGFPSREVGALSFTAVEWGAVEEEGGGGGSMVLEVRPLGDEAVEGLVGRFENIAGRLLWDETTVSDLCNVEIREAWEDEDIIWIGDAFPLDESCPDWEDPDALHRAFQKYGLPKEACISFTFDDVEHDFCEPLT